MAKILALNVLLLLAASVAVAAPSADEQKLSQCLVRAEQAPDGTFFDAKNWLKQGGGDRASLCMAFAQFHRGEFILAAQEFSVLASNYDNKNSRHAASLHAQAGLAYMRANDHKKAEEQYAAALKLETQDPEIWLDRATERVSAERYWDAIDDLNQALTIMPDMPDALRLRGQAWVKLGQESRAKVDFERAAMMENNPDLMPASP